MEQTPASRKRQIIATLAVLIVIVVIVGAVTVSSKKKSPDTMTTTASETTAKAPMSTTTPDSTATTTSTTSTYKDGDYTATGSYDSPGGNESITITVTLKADMVTATSATSGANDPEAKEYQNDFISGYKSQVVGKKITSISLSRVSGSSLTSQGFNNALKQIETKAKA